MIFPHGITKKFVTNFRNAVIHVGGCNLYTRLPHEVAENFARNPNYYPAIFCYHCNQNYPVSEFIWEAGKHTPEGSVVGTLIPICPITSP